MHATTHGQTWRAQTPLLHLAQPCENCKALLFSYAPLLNQVIHLSHLSRTPVGSSPGDRIAALLPDNSIGKTNRASHTPFTSISSTTCDGTPCLVWAPHVVLESLLLMEMLFTPLLYPRCSVCAHVCTVGAETDRRHQTTLPPGLTAMHRDGRA
ncbi:hypothetical protein Bbelb_156090 [Branchiostoma belcheri]|nr:hypothetical protein Bbelb_156090 [Branchiostoma belcheri]